MDLSSALGFVLGWSNASTRSALEKQADRIIKAQAEEIKKLRDPVQYQASVWQETKPAKFVHADASTAAGSVRGTLAAFFFLVALFFPPLGIVGLIFVFLREVLWLIAIGCIAVISVEPLGLVEKSVALLIAATCVGCLLSEKISGARTLSKRKRKKAAPTHSLSRRTAFVLAVLLVPAYLGAAILLSLRWSP